MPTIRGPFGPYRFFFVSFDCAEPAHVHVQRERRVCKYWLDPVQLERNHGFAPVELNVIWRLIYTHRSLLLEAWHEHCGGHY